MISIFYPTRLYAVGHAIGTVALCGSTKAIQLCIHNVPFCFCGLSVPIAILRLKREDTLLIPRLVGERAITRYYSIHIDVRYYCGGSSAVSLNGRKLLPTSSLCGSNKIIDRELFQTTTVRLPPSPRNRDHTMFSSIPQGGVFYFYPTRGTM